MHFFIVSKCQNYNLFISLCVCVCAKKRRLWACLLAQEALPACVLVGTHCT